MVIEGLKAWEDKMAFVGVIDYLGLSSALYKHKDKIKPSYRCVLVDEVQDFGTMELKIIKRLVPEKENNIFLCGDVAQQVYFKHHKITKTGIDIIGRSMTIRKNYRNSREILGAAYSILRGNIDFAMLRSDDFEILEPEYANFSTPKPLILKSTSINEEFGCCLNYLRKNLEPNQKACIAICGYSIFDIKGIGATLALPVLDGNVSIEDNTIFLSDLEQTKGFEFDIVCIINCNHDVIPNPTFPKDEWYREICKFYVAMTRAKLSLILSHSGNESQIMAGSKEYFIEADWTDHEDSSVIEDFKMQQPMVVTHENDMSVLDMTGTEFLYTRKALGISTELCDKLATLVTGVSGKKQTGIASDSRPNRWKTIGDALRERDTPAVNNEFGQKTYKEFKDLFRDFRLYPSQ